jgi:hypothetical protein
VCVCVCVCLCIAKTKSHNVNPAKDRAHPHGGLDWKTSKRVPLTQATKRKLFLYSGGFVCKDRSGLNANKKELDMVVTASCRSQQVKGHVSY